MMHIFVYFVFFTESDQGEVTSCSTSTSMVHDLFILLRFVRHMSKSHIHELIAYISTSNMNIYARPCTMACQNDGLL